MIFQEGIEKGVKINFFEYNPRRRRIIIFSVFSVIAIMTIIVFFVLRGVDYDRTEIGNTGQKTIGQETKFIESPFVQALKEGDVERCEKIPFERDKIVCMLEVNIKKRNAEFCNDEILKKEYKYDVGFIDKDKKTSMLQFSGSDFCWYRISEITGVNRCANIKDSEARRQCLIRFGGGE